MDFSELPLFNFNCNIHVRIKVLLVVLHAIYPGSQARGPLEQGIKLLQCLLGEVTFHLLQVRAHRLLVLVVQLSIVEGGVVAARAWLPGARLLECVRRRLVE